MSSFIDVHLLLEYPAAEVGISETIDSKQIDLAAQCLLKMMEQPEKPPGGLQIGDFKLDEQINIAIRRTPYASTLV
jgi:hypothetical protein